MKKVIFILGLLVSITACGRKITGNSTHQYFAVNKGILEGKFTIKENDLIVNAKIIRFSNNAEFTFASVDTLVDEPGKVIPGKVIIRCKKIKGKKNYHIQGLKADQIEQRFKIFIH